MKRVGPGSTALAAVAAITLSCGEPAPGATATARHPAASSDTRTVVDSRGAAVAVPRNPQRVVTISDCLIEEIMIVLGVEDRLAGVGSACLIEEFRYEFEGTSQRFAYSGGKNPALLLNPEMADLPLFVRSGTEINFETLAGLEPDLLLIDLGSCSLNWRNEPRAMPQGLERLKGLGIPTLILQGPNSGGSRNVESLSRVARILGEVFGESDKAAELAETLEKSIEPVVERTKGVPDSSKPSVLLLGLNPNVRGGSGAIGLAYGARDIHSHIVDRLVNARNAYRRNTSAILNLEQILSMNPDVLILPTSNGFHPPRELYDVSHFQTLDLLEAVRERRVAALPWSPCNCDKRLEYPIDVMIIASAVYPDLFVDIELDEWILQFFGSVYGVDRATAMRMLQALWLDWVL